MGPIAPIRRDLRRLGVPSSIDVFHNGRKEFEYPTPPAFWVFVLPLTLLRARPFRLIALIKELHRAPGTCPAASTPSLKES